MGRAIFHFRQISHQINQVRFARVDQFRPQIQDSVDSVDSVGPDYNQLRISPSHYCRKNASRT